MCDIVTTSLVQTIPKASLDFVSCIFCLSAIPKENHLEAIKNIVTVLKPGGKLLFRDYHVGDSAQQRFQKATEPPKLDTNLYVRQDGTMSYFFDPEELINLCSEAGLELDNLRKVERSVENRKQEVCLDRSFLQALFLNKLSASQHAKTGTGDVLMSEDVTDSISDIEDRTKAISVS